MSTAREKRLEAAREIINSSAAMHIAIQTAQKHGVPRDLFFELAQAAWDQELLVGERLERERGT